MNIFIKTLSNKLVIVKPFKVEETHPLFLFLQNYPKTKKKDIILLQTSEGLKEFKRLEKKITINKHGDVEQVDFIFQEKSL